METPQRARHPLLRKKMPDNMMTLDQRVAIPLLDSPFNATTLKRVVTVAQHRLGFGAGPSALPVPRGREKHADVLALELVNPNLVSGVGMLRVRCVPLGRFRVQVKCLGVRAQGLQPPTRRS